VTPHRRRRKVNGQWEPYGTLILDRVFRGVGRIEVASGQPDTVEGRRRYAKMDRMLTELFQDGQHDYLRRLRAGEITPLQLWDAYKGHRLDSLPSAPLLMPLADSFKAWIETTPAGKHTVLGRLTAQSVFAAFAPTATVGDLPDVLQRYRLSCHQAGRMSAYNHNRGAVLRFLGSTLGPDHPLTVQASRVERLKERPKRKRGLTLDEMRAVLDYLPAPQRKVWWELCLTGMRPAEYFSGQWRVLGDRIEVLGTKTAAAERSIPMVEPITGTTLHKTGMRHHLNRYAAVKLEPYTARRTFANLMELAGIPRTRRRTYLGHSGKDVTDLYERAELTAYLKEDAEKLRGVLGLSGLKLMKEQA
jgi:integrase